MDEQIHGSLAPDAFATLPDRWRTVLWHMEIAHESPAQIASMLGMMPTSVSALVCRARVRLRKPYQAQCG